MTDFNDINDPSNDFDNSTILDIDTSDAIEPSCVEPGEYKIRITGFAKDSNGNIVQKSAAGNKYFRILFDIPDEPASKSLSGFFMVPDATTMDPKKLNNAKWNIEVFKKAFGMAEINFNDMVGREGWAMIKLVPEGEYPEKNEVAKYISGASSTDNFDKF